MEKGKTGGKGKQAAEGPLAGSFRADAKYITDSIEGILSSDGLPGKKKKVLDFRRNAEKGPEPSPGSTVSFIRSSFYPQLDQMSESLTAQRLDYYARRLLKSVDGKRTSAYSDINLRRWRDYSHIRTDSLWQFERRGKGEGQDASYWGNFIPEIPQQMIERYTRKGEWVLDPFIGSGTTVVESVKLGRNCIGLDINENAVNLVREKLARLRNTEGVSTSIIRHDSRSISRELLQREAGVGSVQLAILHPPYFDVVKFSGKKGDLSAAGSVDQFLSMFSEVMAGVDSVLDRGRYLCIVIGDKYDHGDLIPLSHMVSGIALKHGYTFKGIVVKNIEKTKGKRGSEMLWRYRALAGGFYVFKHEYILVFRRP